MNLQYFYVYETDLPDTVKGFSHFGPFHLGVLAFLAAVAVAAGLWYRKQPEMRQIRVGHIIGISLVAMDFYKNMVLFLLGHMAVEYLPLHLCGLSLFMELLYSYRRTPFWGNVLYCLSAPGALAALLFPDWVRYPVLSFMTLHDFSTHGLLVIYPCMLLIAGKIRPDIRYLWKVLAFLLGLAFPMMAVNHLLHTDFMFLRLPSIGSPLIIIRQIFGAKGYLFGYFLLAAAVITAFYLPPAVVQLIQRCRKRNEK